MEIKDIMEQEIRNINSLIILRDILTERSKEYDSEHPLKTYVEDCVIRINDRPSFGIRQIDAQISENYNMIIEWLTEDMTERELHNLYENDEFLSFWEDFKLYARCDQERFIKERNGNELNKLYSELKKCDILEVAYNKIEEELFAKALDEKMSDEDWHDDNGPCVCDPHSFRNKEKKQ